MVTDKKVEASALLGIFRVFVFVLFLFVLLSGIAYARPGLLLNSGAIFDAVLAM